jgi:dCTP deaminase
MSHGILPDHAIRQAVVEGLIRIEPFDDRLVNPASYDLTLGGEVLVYKDWCIPVPIVADGIGLGTELGAEIEDGRYFRPLDHVLDTRKPPETIAFQMHPTKGWVLRPGVGYLLHTRERIWTEEYVAIIDGKSSIGRLFIQIHATAGYVDSGFDGQYTLEIIVQHPIRIYPGMRFAQVRFQTLQGKPDKLYGYAGGHYVGRSAMGAVASMAHKQFTNK